MNLVNFNRVFLSFKSLIKNIRISEKQLSRKNNWCEDYLSCFRRSHNAMLNAYSSAFSNGFQKHEKSVIFQVKTLIKVKIIQSKRVNVCQSMLAKLASKSVMLAMICTALSLEFNLMARCHRMNRWEVVMVLTYFMGTEAGKHVQIAQKSQLSDFTIFDRAKFHSIQMKFRLNFLTSIFDKKNWAIFMIQYICAIFIHP